MVDIHSHTTYSDGSDSVREILIKAQEAGLTYFSITDHNTVEAYFDDAIKHKDKWYDGKILTGVEITTTYNGEIIEVLGYGIKPDLMKKKLIKHVYSFRDKQLLEFDLIKKEYKLKGINLDYDSIKFDPNISSSRKAIWRELIKDEILVNRFSNPTSVDSSSKFTRQEVYNPESYFYVDESTLYPSLNDTVQMIHESGGIAFLAHLYVYGRSKEIRDDLIEIVKQSKLDGLECYYSTFTEAQSIDLVEYCHKHNLLLSGGSDYHGTRKPNIHLGSGEGSLKVPKAIFDNWPKDYLDKFF